MAQMAWVQWNEMKGVCNHAHPPKMSLIGWEEEGIPIFGLI